jgi:ribosomal protein S18 acetylase RimI-like enzyme
MSELRWSAPSRDDDPAWVALLAAMEAVDERGETYELDDVDDEWASVWSHPATDAVFVWDGPQLVAFAWLKAMPGQNKAHRVACWGGVHPEHRRRGIGTQVLAWQVSRASAMASEFDPALPTRLETDAADHQHDVVTIAARAGFEPIRRFLEVARPTALPVPEVTAPSGLALLPWCAELDDAVRLAHAESFVDHWGSEPRSAEEWRQWYTGHRSFRPDLSEVAVDSATREVVSYVLVAAYPQDWETLAREAWINTVGTVPSWRGRGVARWAMTDVLQRIAVSETGFERAILGVDADNPTGALGLYRSLGFEDVRAVTNLARSPLD